MKKHIFVFFTHSFPVVTYWIYGWFGFEHMCCYGLFSLIYALFRLFRLFLLMFHCSLNVIFLHCSSSYESICILHGISTMNAVWVCVSFYCCCVYFEMVKRENFASLLPPANHKMMRMCYNFGSFASHRSDWNHWNTKTLRSMLFSVCASASALCLYLWAFIRLFIHTRETEKHDVILCVFLCVAASLSILNDDTVCIQHAKHLRDLFHHIL